MVWWCSDVFEKNMQLADVELDVTKRGELMRKAIAGFTDDVAHINLLVTSGFMVLSPKIKGFDYNATATPRFDTVYRID
jgi:hypothetical protein